MPKVTVLMAVYNGEKYLRAAMESILNQTFRDFELMIIDDASTDSTPEIISSYPDPRIRVLKNETNLGLTKSLNKGLKEAVGEYVARMDADDISLPERLVQQVSYLDKHPDIALIGCRVEVIDDKGQSLGISHSLATTRESIFYWLIFNNVLTHSSVMFRRDVVMNLGGYDESHRYVEDYGLWNKLSLRFGMELLDEVHVKWRLSPGGISQQHRNAQKANAKKVFIEHLNNVLSDLDARTTRHLVYVHEKTDSCFGLLYIYMLWRYNKLIVANCPTHLNRARLSVQWRRKAYQHFKRNAMRYQSIRKLNAIVKMIAGKK